MTSVTAVDFTTVITNNFFALYSQSLGRVIYNTTAFNKKYE